MTLLLTALLASAQVLPAIDRSFLEAQARIEMTQRASVKVQSASPRRDEGRAARALLENDLEALSTICASAAHATDSGGFLSRIGYAYGMSNGELISLRTKCAAYMLGRRDGQQVAVRKTRT